MVEDAYIEDPLNLKKFHFSLAGNMFVGGVRFLNKNISQYQTPVLILHGSNDKIVPFTFSERLFNLIPIEDKQIIIYKDNYHEIFNDLEKERVYSDVITWLNQKVSS